MPKILNLLFSIFFFFIFVTNVFASGFQITRIGNLDVTGSLLSEWWYTGANPTLSGKAVAGSTVNITIDGVSNSVQATSGGQWFFTPTTVTSDHEIVLTSSGSTISFTLHAGQAVPSNVVSSGVGGEEVSHQPVAGATLPTLTLLVGGIIVFIGGLKLALIKKRVE